MSLPSPWSEDFYFGSDDEYRDEILHYGVKGMKWGVINERAAEKAYQRQKKRRIAKDEKIIKRAGVSKDILDRYAASAVEGWKVTEDYHRLFNNERLKPKQIDKAYTSILNRQNEVAKVQHALKQEVDKLYGAKVDDAIRRKTERAFEEEYDRYNYKSPYA